jgi:hypothetical protein
MQKEKEKKKGLAGSKLDWASFVVGPPRLKSGPVSSSSLSFSSSG